MPANRRWPFLLFSAARLLTMTVPSAETASAFVNFESGQVRPLALSPDGSLLFATNTPANRLAVFTATAKGLARITDVPVGLEPVAVAVRENGAGTLDVWVVNHLSDSVSIVRVDPAAPEHASVVGTLQVGDEPRDIVFAGSGPARAFVTTARRGQNLPSGLSPEFDTPGVGRALVWAFAADDPFADTAFDADASPSPAVGEPLSVIELFGDSPRALAASPDGSRVYAAIFLSGNQTSVVSAPFVGIGGLLPPPPDDSPFFPDDFPLTSLIVRRDPASGAWQDELARDWTPYLRALPPDGDVFTIDADADPPALVPGGTVAGVGTVLYAMAARPTDGALFVANTEARNEVRFEPLIDAIHGLQGRFVDNRITVISPASGAPAVRPVGLNPHVDQTRPTGPATEVAQSLALPTAVAFSADGRRLYATSFGTERIAILDSLALEAGTVSRTTVTVGGGPSGLALDEPRDRLYVLNRFDQTIAVVEDAGEPETAHLGSTIRLGFDPSPPAVTRGRRFLFDARLSGHGDVACASCHVFAEFDGLAWDLGDPYGPILQNANDPALPAWHPMKGPMVTQSLRGLADAGPMHWRGDRTAAADGGSPFDSAGAFKQFNRAFVTLMGGRQPLGSEPLQAFTDWVLTIRYPPNPVARLDGVPTPAESRGSALFSAPNKCSTCHALPLGTRGVSVDLGGSIKIPHLRGLYAKIGMDDQIRGFGFFRDGVNEILELPLLLVGTPQEMLGVPDLDAYLRAFPTGLAPIVGQQVSATPATVADPAALARRDLLLARADAGDCDVVVHARFGGVASSALYDSGTGRFVRDRVAAPGPTPAGLWAEAGTAGNAQVWTCVPPGSGTRLAIDRDGDGFLDGDEKDAGASPVDAVSRPGRATTSIGIATLRVRDTGQDRRTFRFRSRRRPPSIVVPTAGGAGDPTRAGATVRVYDSAGSGEQLTVALPASAWRATASGYRYRSGGTAVSSVAIKPGKLSVTGGGALFGYTLDESAQRRIVVRLTIGMVVDWCAEGVADRPPARDEPGRFVVRDLGPADDCPAPPAG